MILFCSLFIIILVHELGHLWAAKICKCGVDKFSIGFGRPLFQFTWHKTIYQIAPILLGGFCNLQGELKYSRSKFAFTNKTYSQKVFISFAGILMNILTGLIGFGIFLLTKKDMFLIFAIYSILMGLTNALPFIPCLDGSYPVIFLFEKCWGKKKTYRVWGKINQQFFKWLMILNLLTIPYVIYLIYMGQIL